MINKAIKKRRTTCDSSIVDDKQKQATFCKRKRGLLKKAIELSQLCDQYIYVMIFDEERQKLIEF